MRVYKQKYTYKGKVKKCKVWYIEFEDHLGLKHSIPADKSRDVAMHYGKQIERFIRHRKLHEKPDLDLTNWLYQEAPEKFRQKLFDLNIIGKDEAEAARPLLDQVDIYERFLRSDHQKQYAVDICRHCRRIIEAAGFKTWRDINESAVRQVIARFTTHGNKQEKALILSDNTQKHYLRSIKMFCRWAAVKANIILRSPLDGMTVGKPIEKRHIRRVLTTEDLSAFLEAVGGFEKRYFMTGYERQVLYRLALETGLRANELRMLDTACFDLKNRVVRVEAMNTKNKKVCTLPLRNRTALLLAGFLKDRPAKAKVFTVPLQTARMIEDDLTEAGIDYKDDEGQVFDFHALRHQFGTMLAQSGIHPKTAMSLMRHSDINLTMALYTHSYREHEAAAIESLPDFTQGSKRNEKTA